MERPAKRQCMDWNEDFSDESDQDIPSDEIALEREHKRNVLAVRNKLKHRFEDIFLKYERDFSGIGDEIDLETGEVVVDNGHLYRMRNEQDDGLSDGSSGRSAIHSRSSTNGGLHVRSEDDLRVTRRPSKTSPKSPNQRHLPRDPRWAAPEIPGLSHDLISIDDSELAEELPTIAHERSPSPEISIWDMTAYTPINPKKDNSDKEARSRWTLDELTLLCRLKNMDRKWTMREVQEILPHRPLVSITKRWNNIEKGVDPATYLQNKWKGCIRNVESLPRLHSSPISDINDKNDDESDSDELTQPTPVKAISTHHLTPTPRSQKFDFSPSIKREPHAAVSPLVAQLAHTETAPPSSSPITSALTWLSRSTALEPLEADIALADSRQSKPRLGSPTHTPSKRPKSIEKTAKRAVAIKLEDRENVASSNGSQNSMQHLGHHATIASVSSDEEETLSQIPTPASTAVKRPSLLPTKLLRREIPDSDDQVSSSQSSRPQQREDTVPDSQDHPESSREAVPLDPLAFRREQSTPSKCLTTGNTDQSRERKKASSLRHVRKSLSGLPQTPTSFSLLEINSDDELMNPPIPSSSSAPRKPITESSQNSSVTASEKRSQCGREGFSCGRIICLRCA